MHCQSRTGHAYTERTRAFGYGWRVSVWELDALSVPIGGDRMLEVVLAGPNDGLPDAHLLPEHGLLSLSLGSYGEILDALLTLGSA